MDREVDYFVVESCWESLLTAVFEAFRRRIRPRGILRGGDAGSIFEQCYPKIGSDSEKAERVWNKVCRAIDPMIAKMITVAHSVDCERIDLAIFRVMCKIVEGKRYYPGDYSDSDMAEILWCYRRVGLTH